MNRALFWAPRALCILWIAFLSMFALDVFEEDLGFWRTLLDLTIHLIPSFVLVAALAITWRWEWVGTVVFGLCGLALAFVVRGSWPVKAIFAAPCLVAAGLFLANWRRKRAQLVI